MSNDNGGPAFPHKQERNEPTGMDGWQLHTPGDYPGMTLRDYFAAKAMQGLLAHPLCQPVGRGYETATACVVREAYIVADAMLKERAA